MSLTGVSVADVLRVNKELFCAGCRSGTFVKESGWWQTSITMASRRLISSRTPPANVLQRRFPATKRQLIRHFHDRSWLA